jgi:putative redox protein
MTRPPNHVVIDWAGEHRFDAGRASGGPKIRVDADAATGPGPVDTLLIALGTCTAVDVVDILAKRRTPVESLVIEVVGTRHEGGFAARRLVDAKLVYRMQGAGIERVHAERAIELAVNKYCSVRDSLDRTIPVEWALELNGEG